MKKAPICGVYKITNTLTGKFYIGSSVNIKSRWSSHKNSAKSNDYKHLEMYKDFNEYGLDVFTFEVLEECKPEDRLKLEMKYITELNARLYGYNAQGLEKHHNHKLTVEDVIYIREHYNNHSEKMDVYYEFEDRINFTGFHKVWHGYTWKGVMDEVYTEENKQWHASHGQSRPGSKNGRARLNEIDVKNIRDRKRAGEKMSDVYEDYKDRIKLGSFSNIWCYHNWKNID